MDSKNEYIKLLKAYDCSNIYIFGAGTFGKIFGEFFTKNNIPFCGFIDNNPDKWNTKLLNKEIVSLDSITDKKAIVVVISISPIQYALPYKEIYKQLIDSGVNKENIIELSRNLELTQEIMLDVKNPDLYINKTAGLKNIYEGQKCFLLGNGPSLTIEDLRKTDKFLSFGCNTLIQFMKTYGWYPSFFYFEDTIFIQKYVSTKNDIDFLTDKCKLCFTSIVNEIFDKYRDSYQNLFFFKNNRASKEVYIQEDITKGLILGGTSLFGMIQLLVYMGIKEIYLLGVDFSFHKEARNDGQLKINDNIKNHAEGMNQVSDGIYYVDFILKGWLAAKQYADSHGIKIYNATRGGKLEVFPRVDFDSLFEN